MAHHQAPQNNDCSTTCEEDGCADACSGCCNCGCCRRRVFLVERYGVILLSWQDYQKTQLRLRFLFQMSEE